MALSLPFGSAKIPDTCKADVAELTQSVKTVSSQVADTNPKTNANPAPKTSDLSSSLKVKGSK